MLFDSHIHFGQFYDLYTSSMELKRFLDSVGVERFAASSTTICEGDYDKVMDKLKNNDSKVVGIIYDLALSYDTWF